MATEIWREFDPNLDVPEELKNVRVKTLPDTQDELPDPNADIDPQDDTYSDEDSELDDDVNDDELGVPSSFVIISQTVRTAPDGSQVVDVVIDVEEIPGASNYEFRVTK